MSTGIKERMSTMVSLFVIEGLVVGLPITAIVDSTLLKAKGHVWHKSSMEKVVIPRLGIDTDASWDTVYQGMVFGYKLH